MSFHSKDASKSLRVMVTEDEPLIAWALEDTLSEMGLEVVGPFNSVQEASRSIKDCIPEIAVLDVNLLDGEVFPVADLLHEHDVPIIFHTANVQGADLTSRYRGAQVVLKPSNPLHLRRAIGLVQEQSRSYKD